MKHLYKLLALLVTIATAPQAMQAGEWSFAWPLSGTSSEEKANNNANGLNQGFFKIFQTGIG